MLGDSRILVLLKRAQCWSEPRRLLEQGSSWPLPAQPPPGAARPHVRRVAPTPLRISLRPAAITPEACTAS
jgi:hypothetical protein